MTNPVTDHPPADPRIGLLRAAAEQLIPLFEVSGVDRPLARQMALSAMAGYDPQTRADYVNIARTIAFSMAALAVLAKAAASDMTLPEQMRAYGRANALNRSADQSERTMMQRRRAQLACPPTVQPAWVNPGADKPLPDIAPTDAPISLSPADEAIIEAAIGEAMQAFNAHRIPPEAALRPPEKAPAPSDAASKPAAPRPASVAQPGQRSVPTPTQAIRHSAANAGTAAPGIAQFKAELLRQTAMPLPPVHGPAQRPV